MSRNGKHRSKLKRWYLHVDVMGQVNFSARIFVIAPGGGMAKAKVWPKFQKMVEDLGGGKNNGKGLKFYAFLKATRDQNTPIYILRESHSFYLRIVTTTRPSQAFEVRRN